MGNKVSCRHTKPLSLNCRDPDVKEGTLYLQYHDRFGGLLFICSIMNVSRIVSRTVGDSRVIPE